MRTVPDPFGAMDNAGEAVYLLHGIWMRGFAMGLVARRLREAGFTPRIFDYASLHEGADRSSARLAEAIAREPAGRVHVVGHSLGGLVALLATQASDRAGRTVCLGSPLLGSDAARRVAGFAPWAMGASADRLCAGLDRWHGTREVGVIAGRLPFGLARVLGGFDDDSDGTVRVAETRLPGIHDHLVLPASHTGLVFSGEVANAVVRYLQSGRLAAASTEQA